MSSLVSAFVGDALSLGVHWVYNVDDIQTAFPAGVYDYRDAGLASYHLGKRAGELTHYGDTLLHAMRYANEHGVQFDLTSYRRSWFKWYETYAGYKDHAGRDTFSILARGEDGASASTDLAGLVRLPVLLAIHRGDDLSSYLRDVPAAISATHNHPLTIAGGVVYARILWAVVAGRESISVAITSAAEWALEQPEAEIKTLSGYISLAQSCVKGENNALKMGLMRNTSCGIQGGFPLVIYFLMLGESKPTIDVLSLSAGIGGDSASRNILIGAVLGGRKVEDPALLSFDPVRYLAPLDQHGLAPLIAGMTGN